MQNNNTASDKQYDKRKREQIAFDIDNAKPDRGGCLISFLALNIGINGFIVITLVGKLLSPQLDIGSSLANTPTTMYIFLITVVINLIASIGLWKWKKWGYYGMILSFSITIVWGFYISMMIEVIRAFIWVILLYFLAKPVKNYLE